MKLGILFCVIFSLSLSRAETINYTYDDAGRLIRVSYGSGKTIHYTYDQAGNLLSRLVTSTPPEPAPAILNQDSSVNRASNPADKGSTVVLLWTAKGQLKPKPLLPVSVTIGGIATSATSRNVRFRPINASSSPSSCAMSSTPACPSSLL